MRPLRSYPDIPDKLSVNEEGIVSLLMPFVAGAKQTKIDEFCLLHIGAFVFGK